MRLNRIYGENQWVTRRSLMGKNAELLTVLYKTTSLFAIFGLFRGWISTAEFSNTTWSVGQFNVECRPMLHVERANSTCFAPFFDVFGIDTLLTETHDLLAFWHSYICDFLLVSYRNRLCRKWWCGLYWREGTATTTAAFASRRQSKQQHDSCLQKLLFESCPIYDCCLRWRNEWELSPEGQFRANRSTVSTLYPWGYKDR